MLNFYILLQLPIKIVLAHAVTVTDIFGINVSQIFNVLFLFFNIIYIILFLQKFLSNNAFRPVFILIILIIFSNFLRPLFSFVFTHNINDFRDFVKLASWLTIIPLAFLALHNEAGVTRLRLSAVVSFWILVVGLVIANIFNIGASAYDSGVFYMGVWSGEAAVSMSLLSLVPYFFLPTKNQKYGRIFTWSAFSCVSLSFVLLVLIMKRSSILAFIFFIFVGTFFFALQRKYPFSFGKFLMFGLSFALVLVGVFAVLQLSRPDLIQYRFKDYSKFKKSGDVDHFGAGRLGLLREYFKLYMDGSIAEKVIGVDIGGYIDAKKGGYLYLGRHFRLDPHNDYMEILLYSGIIGLTVLIAFLIIVNISVFDIFSRSNDLLTIHLCAVMFGMFVIYFVGSIAGLIYRIFPMTCFALLLGCVFGVGSKEKDSLQYG